MAELAPLVTTPDAPVPPGGAAEWFQGAGGARLRAALFAPRGRARGSIVLSPGRSEPIEKYYEFIGECLERGFVVLAHDWRGQGLSARELPDRLKGHARGYRAFLEDHQALLRTFGDRLPKPWVAVGHSMGGALALLAMAHGERRFAGAILSAPMLGVRTGKVSPARARWAVRLHCLFGRANRYVRGQPGRPFDSDFETNVLTHDRARYARAAGLIAAEPQLALGAPTWGWLDFAFRAGAYLARPDRLREITAPVIIVSAGDDRLVDNAAQAAAARHLPQGKLITVPGAYHEILMETDPMRNIFMRAFDALLGRAAPKPAAAPKPVAPPAAAAPKPAATAAVAPAEAKPAAPAAAKPPVAKAPVAKPPVAKPSAAKSAPAAKPAAQPAAAAVKAKPATAKKPAAKAASNAKKPAAAPKPAAPAKAAAKPAVKKSTAKPAAAKSAPKTGPKAAAAAVAAPKTAAAKKSAPAKAPPAKAPAAKAAATSPAKKPAAKKPAAKKPGAAKKPTSAT